MYKDGTDYIETLVNGKAYKVIDIKPDQKSYEVFGNGQVYEDDTVSTGLYKITGAKTIQNKTSCTILVCENPFEPRFNEGWRLEKDEIRSFEATEFYVELGSFNGKLELE